MPGGGICLIFGCYACVVRGKGSVQVKANHSVTWLMNDTMCGWLITHWEPRRPSSELTLVQDCGFKLRHIAVQQVGLVNAGVASSAKGSEPCIMYDPCLLWLSV